jgi:hypothetical protein
MQILAVHRHDPLKSPEIIEVEEPRPLGREIVASQPRSAYRARVRRLAKLITMRSGGVDGDLAGESFTLDQPTKHTFSYRRPADVSGANEQHLCRRLLMRFFAL